MKIVHQKLSLSVDNTVALLVIVASEAETTDPSVPADVNCGVGHLQASPVVMHFLLEEVV